MVAHKKKIHLSHERTTESYKCRECHKVFATAISLASHYRMHVTPQAPIAPIATAPMAPIGPALGQFFILTVLREANVPILQVARLH